MTTSGTLTVRPLATDEEIDTFCYLATETFSPPGGDTATDARLWRRYVEALPEFDPRQLRGVFDGEVFAGGCIIYERELCAGEARLRTACIGGVVTHPEHRLRGVGTALMRDAITFAERHGHALLLLDGIPNFYHRWGYTDIYDLTEHIIERAAVATLPATGCTTRPATLDESPALLALYQRHYSRYTGSFTRTLEQQRVRLERSCERQSTRSRRRRGGQRAWLSDAAQRGRSCPCWRGSRQYVASRRRAPPAPRAYRRSPGGSARQPHLASAARLLHLLPACRSPRCDRRHPGQRYTHQCRAERNVYRPAHRLDGTPRLAAAHSRDASARLASPPRQRAENCVHELHAAHRRRSHCAQHRGQRRSATPHPGAR